MLISAPSLLLLLLLWCQDGSVCSARAWHEDEAKRCDGARRFVF